MADKNFGERLVDETGKVIGGIALGSTGVALSNAGVTGIGGLVTGMGTTLAGSSSLPLMATLAPWVWPAAVFVGGVWAVGTAIEAATSD